MSRILVVGADGGLGREVHREMNKVGHVVPFERDITNLEHIQKFLSFSPAFDMIIYCAGVNYISLFDNVSEADFFQSMDVNCFGFARLIQAMRLHEKLNPCATACLVTSNAANIAMSHSLSYNCSKAAANMMVRQMAREIRVDELVIFGVAPNKLKGTGMSKQIEKKVCEMRDWSPEAASVYQLAALPARRETLPAECAQFIRQMIAHDSTLHGTILPYGGPQQ
jgi:NAD(P)-dependent dehydrogenase (short-subunit alcohol dehydrogenase family)